MAGRKKTFPCGHTGKGQYCHKCSEQQRLVQERAAERQAWASQFENDAIDLTNLPKHLVEKSRGILKKIEDGEPWQALGGKKLHHDSGIIRIPVGYNYRLLCRLNNSRLIPYKVLSHEEYNVIKPGGK